MSTTFPYLTDPAGYDARHRDLSAFALHECVRLDYAWLRRSAVSDAHTPRHSPDVARGVAA